MKDLKIKILMGIIATLFLVSGCSGNYQKVITDWQVLPDMWPAEKISTAMLAARMIETRMNLRYDQGAEPWPVVQNGLGIMLNDGLLLTLKHIVEAPKSETVRIMGKIVEMPLITTDLEYFLDGEEIDIVGTFDDIAVFDTHKSTNQQIPFGDSDLVKIGDPVLLIGWSFAIDLNVKSGMISSIIASQYGVDEDNLANSFLHTAPINYGDSGGMLLNSDFEVIAILNAAGPGEHLSFAIKINEIKSYIQTILFGCGIGVIPY